MTKKDFELIAAALKESKPEQPTVYNPNLSRHYFFLAQWDDTVSKITDMLESTNKRFGRNKFLEACGVD